MNGHRPAGLSLRMAERGRAVAARFPDVLGVGVGWKHSRAEGYGARARPSVKFIVSTKRRRSRLLPKTLSVRWRGKRVRWPTDVMEVDGATTEVSVCRAVGGSAGSPGIVLGGSDGGMYLMTAGHVFLPHLDEQGDVVALLAESRIGVLVRGSCSLLTPDGIVDVALIRLDPGAEARFAAPPWSGVSRVVTERELLELYLDPTVDACRVFGAVSEPSGRLDTVYTSSVRFPDLAEAYAPMLVEIRSDGVPFGGGNSGALSLTADGGALAIHVVGKTSEPNRGWGVAVDSAIRVLESVLGIELSLA